MSRKGMRFEVVVADFSPDRSVAVVHNAAQVVGFELLLHLQGVFDEAVGHGQDGKLLWRQPKRKFAGAVFNLEHS